MWDALLSRTLLPAFLIAVITGCGDAPRDSVAPVALNDLPVVDAASLVEMASTTIGGLNDPENSFADVVSVLELNSDSLLVLDGAAPFVHLFDSQGERLASFGREGDGPGELNRPWTLAADSSTIWILDRGQLLAWDRQTYEERHRAAAAPQTATLTSACGEPLLAILQGPRPGSGNNVYQAQFGLAALTADSTWTVLRPVPPLNTPLQLGWPRFSGSAVGAERVAIMHWWDKNLEIIPCQPDGGLRDFAYTGEGEWDMVPVPEGIASSDSIVVALFADRSMSVDTTHVAVASLETGIVRRFKIAGRFAVFDATPDRIWLAYLSVAPEVFAIPHDSFFSWAREQSVAWKE